MRAFPDFGKIFQMGDLRVCDHLIGPRVEITEKVDGSMFAFGIDLDDKLVMRSKGQLLTLANVDKLFAPVVGAVLDREAVIRDHLSPGQFVYGETLCKPKHNTLAYANAPKGHLAIFGFADLARINGTFFGAEYMVLKGIAYALDFDVVPLIATGVDSREALNMLIENALDRESFLGKEKIEGVVLRNLDMAIPFFGPEPILVTAKCVRADFKERNSAEWAGEKQKAHSKVESYLMQFRTDARWLKAIQYLRDAGQLEGRMQDMPKIVDRIAVDLEEEERVNIERELYQLVKKDLHKITLAGLPEYYKKYLWDVSQVQEQVATTLTECKADGAFSA